MSLQVMAPFVNIAAYKFVSLDRLLERRAELRDLCKSLQLKGTILLSREGINLFLAGTPEGIQQFLGFLKRQPAFESMEVKESPSDHQPFSRMLVRLKKEIITLGVEGIDPAHHTSPKLPPHELLNWIRDGKKFHFLDTRNTYEVELGTFRGAQTLPIDSFRQFPEAIKSLPENWKREPIVMFCTGGIRCEKAGPLMEREGFEQIYQLEGGILKYFEDCRGEHYDGDCFVFDKRVAVNPQLLETEAGLCFKCQAVLSPDDQQDERYCPPHYCPHCFKSRDDQMAEVLQIRNQQLRRVADPLPGSQPYDNIRPINVPLKFDHQSAAEVLTGMHAHVPLDYWRQESAAGHLRYQGEPVALETKVRAGWRIDHLIPQTVEPAVNAEIRVLYEDEWLVGVAKPAPLPMHPCGRFNRNSLIYLLDQVYASHHLRMLHRLDANTTGAVLLARTKEVSRRVHPLFASGKVSKKYLALVDGIPKSERFQCTLPLSRQAGRAGGRFADEEGLYSVTQFRLLRTSGNHALIECIPVTGRTNQIRIHLTALGFPIVGDPLYRVQQDIRVSEISEDVEDSIQTLSPQAPPMCLHSLELVLQHPYLGNELKIQAPPPPWAVE